MILPLVPDRSFGPYDAIDPYEIWLLVVAFTAISWVGHILVRVLGRRRGLLVTGLAGGFVSASATTAAMGRRARADAVEDRGIGALVSATLLASVATFVQLLGIMTVASPSIASALWPACVVGAITLAIVAVLDARRHPVSSTGSIDDVDDEPTARPFALRSALVLALILTVAMVVSRWAVATFGSGGVTAAAAAAGLADAHAGALAAAEVEVAGLVGIPAALIAIAASMAANTITKTVLAFVVGGRRFGSRVAVGIWVAMVGFVVVALLTALMIG